MGGKPHESDWVWLVTDYMANNTDISLEDWLLDSRPIVPIIILQHTTIRW